MPRPSKLEQACKAALVDYLGVTEDETLLIITDENYREIANKFLTIANGICKEVIYAEMTPRKFNGEEPPEAIAEAMKSVDAIIAPTTMSLTHTKARLKATDLGVRIGTMPSIKNDTLIRCLSADPQKLVERTHSLFMRMRGTREIYIETRIGTAFTMPIKRRKIFESTGVLKTIGDAGNIPSGEVYISPNEDMSYGKIVFDGSIAGIGLLKENIIVEIKKGKIKNISGGKQAKQFEEMLKSVGDERAFCVAEFGIGTNDKAQICGEILEDEKVMGTAHVAFGNNITMGGILNVPIHVDGLITKPDIYFDKKQIMKFGEFVY